MTMTPQEQHALDELMAAVPKPAAGPIGLLEGITGASGQAWKERLLQVLHKKDSLELALVEWAGRNRMDAAFVFLGAAAAAFYQAEKDENPKIRTYVDAFYYIATCASVGYADIFAVTQTGKSIAALVMIVGPSLAARVLDRPTQAP
jgi:3-polyprenyl-4-hydroxybenzoate decarboxylase